MQIRSYEEEDASFLMDLFRETVHTVCRSDYSPEQLEAWAPVFVPRKFVLHDWQDSAVARGFKSTIVPLLGGDGSMFTFVLRRRHCHMETWQ